jgi:large subunit ribosomal protein L9
MKLILMQKKENMGEVGDIIDVKRGYGRNYLIPKGFCIPLTPGNMKIFEERKRVENAKRNKEKRVALLLKQKLEKLSVTLPMQVGEDGKLFGSVTTADVSTLLEKEGHKIDKRNIHIEESIKEIGVYNVKLSLHPEVNANIKVWVVSK